MSEEVARAEQGILGWIDRDITGPMADFNDPNHEWRRLFSEFYGTFLMVLAAAIAVGLAYVLRGPGGGMSGSGAAQGDLFTQTRRPDQA